MNSDLSLAALGRASSKFLHRYHIILFVVIVFGGLAVITFLLNATISKASEAAPLMASTKRPSKKSSNSKPPANPTKAPANYRLARVTHLLSNIFYSRSGAFCGAMLYYTHDTARICTRQLSCHELTNGRQSWQPYPAAC